jgi:hypothetical protein
MDRAIARAIFAVAGEAQAEAHEVGIQHVAEADVRRALRRALQMQLGRVVTPEGASGFKLPTWPGRLLGPDVVVRHADDAATRWRAFVEVKWCRENTMHEALWDLLKLSLAVGLDGVESAYLVVGAPDKRWATTAPCAELLNDAVWDTRELFERYESQWRWLLQGNKSARPTRLPAKIATTRLATVPIHLADGPTWELRAARVEDRGSGWLDLAGGWPTC